jgi:hypothetical protein
LGNRLFFRDRKNLSISKT